MSTVFKCSDQVLSTNTPIFRVPTTSYTQFLHIFIWYTSSSTVRHTTLTCGPLNTVYTVFGSNRLDFSGDVVVVVDDTRSVSVFRTSWMLRNTDTSVSAGLTLNCSVISCDVRLRSHGATHFLIVFHDQRLERIHSAIRVLGHGCHGRLYVQIVVQSQ